MNLRKILLSVIFAFAAVAALAQTPPGPSQSTSPDRETFTVNGVSFTMIKVPGGTFMMGSDSPEAFDEEKPVHSESVSTFYIGQTEVTQALWTAVMGSNPSYFKGDNRPVEWVSWDDCQTFLRKLNQLTGRNFRLPTEASGNMPRAEAHFRTVTNTAAATISTVWAGMKVTASGPPIP